MNLEAQIAKLVGRFEEFQKHIDNRLDDIGDVGTGRHAENVTRLVRMEGKLDVTNGRVNRHDEHLEQHDDRIRVLFKRTEAAKVAAVPGTRATRDDETYGKREVLIFVAGGASLIAAYKFIAWAVPLIKAAAQ